MKKTLAVLLVFVLLLGAVSVAAADLTLDETTDFSGPCLSFDTVDPDSRNDQTVAIAAFDQNGNLEKTKLMTVSGLATYKKIPVNLAEYFGKDSKAAEIRAFAWDFQTLSPVASIGTLSSSSSLVAPTFCTFYDDKKAAVSITFDDANYDAAVYYDSVFEQYGLRGTAMLIADRITDPSIWTALFAKGRIDAGNHSVTHAIRYNTATEQAIKDDIIPAYTTLHTLFPDQSLLTYATPWGQTPNAAIAAIKEHQYANRLAGGGLQDSNPQGDNWYKLKCFTYDAQSAADMNGWIKDAVTKGGWVIELLHGCTDSTTTTAGTYTIPKATFKDHAAYLYTVRKSLWVGTFEEVTAYIYERQNATAKVLCEGKDQILLSLTDTLPDDRFRQPLTLKVNVPSDWMNVSYAQGELSGTAASKLSGGKRYVQINAIPDQGAVLLTKVTE